MPYIHIKSEERKQQEAQVARDFQANMRDSAQRELVEYVTARTKEERHEMERSRR